MNAPSADPFFLELQAALAGRYSLVGELGRGGMGVVYLAREVKLDRLVALKLLPPAFAGRAELRERFLREARTAARLSHPNIIPIFAADEAGPFVFFAMAYVRGETVAQRVARAGPLPPAEVARILRDAAWALAYAHAQGIVHRDVKPDNILLEEGTERVLVGDFGIARTEETALSDPGKLVGTPAFMSPEQAAGDAVDGRSDLYALGLVAHFALTGRLPFSADGLPAAKQLALRLERDAPPVGESCPHAPATLAAAVDRCAALDPAQRFPSAEALAHALDRTLRRSDPLPEPLARWLQGARELPLRHALLSPLLSVPVMVLIELIAIGYQDTWASGAYMLTAVAAPPLLWALARYGETRRLAAAGYGQRDVAVALEREAAEQLAAIAEQRRSRVRRIVDGLLGSSLVTIGAVATSATLASDPVIGLVLGVYTVAGAGTVITRLLAGPRDPVESLAMRLRRRIWGGPGGRRVLRLTSVAKQRGQAALDTHRPTELAVGAAAMVLWEALPTIERKRLPDVPRLVERLETRAQRLRAHLEGADSEPAAAALSETVSALETLRLDLLRLRAGTITTDGLTLDLETVRHLGEEVDAALDARQDVRRLLEGPTPGAD